MADDENKEIIVTESDLRGAGLPSTMEMSPGLAIFFNDTLYNRCKQVAIHMSKAEGMMPRHLQGKPEACFAVVSRAIVWKLDPFSVAMSTYQTPGGSIGYEGRLIQAILENSGKLEGGINYEFRGDWSAVKGRFRLQEGKNGNKYPVPTWGPKEAEGLLVVVSAQVKGETTPRTLDFELAEAFPLNSPLWATAPHRQIRYTAVRAFANQVVPSLLMGVPFDVDPTGFYGEPITEVNPRPTRAEFVPSGEMKPPAAKGKTGFERPVEVTDVQPEPQDASAGTPEPGPEQGEGSAETAPAATSEPVVVQAEMKPGPEPTSEEDDEPADDVGDERSKTYRAAEKMVQGLVAGLADLPNDQLEETRDRGKVSINSLAGLSDDERDALRGWFAGSVLEEMRKPARKKKPTKK